MRVPAVGHRRNAAQRPLRGVDDLLAAPYVVAPEAITDQNLVTEQHGLLLGLFRGCLFDLHSEDH
jgi:hypothetical protein